MVYFNHHIAVQYNPLYTMSHQNHKNKGFGHLKTQVIYYTTL